MATFGWVLLTGAFLILIMVANNSWPWVWAKISAGMPQPGQGNPIVPTPQEATNQFVLSDNPYSVINPPSNSGTSGNITTPPTLVVPTVNGIVQSTSSNQATG